MTQSITPTPVAASTPTTASMNFVIPMGTQITADHRIRIPAGFKIILGTNSILVRR